VRLSEYDHGDHDPGAGLVRRIAWYVCNAVVFASWLVPPSAPKRWLLRCFGAVVGRGVVIKPNVNIKYPWRLTIGDHSWIGEGAWLDNLGAIEIGRNACVSQGARLLTGNHDYRDPRFRLRVGSIRIDDCAWVGAYAVVCPDVTIARGSVISVASVVTRSTREDWVYAGSPATALRPRYGVGEVTARPGDAAASASSSACTSGDIAAR